MARGGFCMPDLATADGYILTVLETKGQNRRCQQTMAGVAGYESLTRRSGQTRQGFLSIESMTHAGAVTSGVAMDADGRAYHMIRSGLSEDINHVFRI